MDEASRPPDPDVDTKSVDVTVSLEGRFESSPSWGDGAEIPYTSRSTWRDDVGLTTIVSDGSLRSPLFLRCLKPETSPILSV